MDVDETVPSRPLSPPSPSTSKHTRIYEKQFHWWSAHRWADRVKAARGRAENEFEEAIAYTFKPHFFTRDSHADNGRNTATAGKKVAGPTSPVSPHMERQARKHVERHQKARKIQQAAIAAIHASTGTQRGRSPIRRSSSTSYVAVAAGQGRIKTDVAIAGVNLPPPLPPSALPDKHSESHTLEDPTLRPGRSQARPIFKSTSLSPQRQRQGSLLEETNYLKPTASWIQHHLQRSAMPSPPTGSGSLREVFLDLSPNHRPFGPSSAPPSLTPSPASFPISRPRPTTPTSPADTKPSHKSPQSSSASEKEPRAGEKEGKSGTRGKANPHQPRHGHESAENDRTTETVHDRDHADTWTRGGAKGGRKDHGAKFWEQLQSARRAWAQERRQLLTVIELQQQTMATKKSTGTSDIANTVTSLSRRMETMEKGRENDREELNGTLGRLIRAVEACSVDLKRLAPQPSFSANQAEEWHPQQQPEQSARKKIWRQGSAAKHGQGPVPTSPSAFVFFPSLSKSLQASKKGDGNRHAPASPQASPSAARSNTSPASPLSHGHLTGQPDVISHETQITRI